MVTDVTLKEVDLSNFRQCVRLTVAKEQERFIATNLFTIAETKVDDSLTPYAICHQDTVVGFCCIEIDPTNDQEDRYWIPRFMIGKEYQGRGYGRAAMDLIINMLSEYSDCSEIKLSYVPENLAARNFYETIGFSIIDEELQEEIVMSYLVKAVVEY